MSRPALLPEAFAAPWRAALFEDTQAQVTVYNAEGGILDHNAHALSYYPQHASLVGLNINELHPPKIATERIEHIQRTLATDRRTVVMGMCRGRWIRATLRPLPTNHYGLPAVLAVCRYIGSEDAERIDDNSDVIRASENDLGILAGLTPRQLEVLVMLGRGMSVPEMSSALNRSIKTLEWHRSEIAKKLGVTHRVHLARIAVESRIDLLLPELTRRLNEWRSQGGLVRTATPVATLPDDQDDDQAIPDA